MRTATGKLFLGGLGAAALTLALSAPANASTLDCSTSCNFVNQFGAIWVTTDVQATGSGVIDSFVRISSNNDVEDGHNTSGRPLLNDENASPTFTHDLTLAQIPVVNIGGTQYFEFLLDINQTGTDPLLSLSQVRICTSATGGLTQADNCPGTLVYNMDNPLVGGTDNNVTINFLLNPGSGAGDLFMYIPTTVIGGSPSTFLYLYSQFGIPNNNNDGFEEWAVRTPTTGGTTGGGVPEPASLLLFGAGITAGVRRLRKA